MPKRFIEEPSAAAMREVRRIQADAYRCGWSRHDLWSTEGWVRFPSPDFGLVCYLDSDRGTAHITDVCRQFIGMDIPDGRGGVVHAQFYNRRVTQPWRRAVDASLPSPDGHNTGGR